MSDKLQFVASKRGQAALPYFETFKFDFDTHLLERLSTLEKKLKIKSRTGKEGQLAPASLVQERLSTLVKKLKIGRVIGREGWLAPAFLVPERLSTLEKKLKIGSLTGREGWLAPAFLRSIGIVLLVSLASTSSVLWAQDRETQISNTAISRQLSSPDPAVRRQAAEELARVAAVDQKKLLEGYHLQEKDRKVRLALEWALYRVGNTNALYRLVRELDSSRYDQAVGYLKQLDSPSLIYPLLKAQDSTPRITAGLLEALGYLGDNETLEVIQPYRDSFAPGLAEAAESAFDRIEARLAQAEPSKPTRPRSVGNTEPTSP